MSTLHSLLVCLLLTDTTRVFAVNMVIDNINELLLVNER